MSFELRGVLEGFYGRPWSWAERSRMVGFMGQVGLNAYMYAPKNDPIHRNRWREPYLPEELDRFRALLERCRENGVEFIFGISPLHFHYSDEADMAALWAKLLPMHDIGVRSFSVLLDDMPDKFRYPDDEARFQTLAGAQAWLNNEVRERLHALGGLQRLIFCPTEYHGTGVSAYLSELGERLHPDIDVFWTGDEVCSATLTTADARTVSKTLKRPIVYWDNYPVNDLDMRFRPHLRPIRGRDADLHTACRGILANASLQPEAAKIPLYTYARYMADPAGYQPEHAWQEALLAVSGDPADAGAVGALADMARWSHLERGHRLDNALLPQLLRFWAAWGGPPPSAGPELEEMPDPLPPLSAAPASSRAQAVSELAAVLVSLHQAARRLLGTMANPHLQRELQPWSEKLLGWTETALYALDVLRLKLEDERHLDIPARRNAALDRLLASRENFHWVAGDLLDQFTRRCLQV